TTATGTVLINPSVVSLVFCLTNLTVYAEVINLYVAAISVIGELHNAATGQVGGCGVVRHAGAQAPAGYSGVVHFEGDVFLTGCTSGTDNNSLTATATGWAATTVIATAVITPTVVAALAYRDV